MTKVYAVIVQGEDSWGTNNNTYETASIHATEKGAKTKAGLVKRSMALYYFTNGETDDENLSPDEILTILNRSDKKKYSQLKTGIAKPDADFWTVLVDLATAASDRWESEASIRDVDVTEVTLED
jgi:hypothetical protein